VLWIATIFTLSSIPSIPEIQIPVSPDKLAHGAIYFVLCLLWNRALLHQNRFLRLQKHALWVALGFTVLHGILDELYQLSVPGRTSDPFDALADAIGAGLFVSWVLWKRREAPEDLT
jgi:VanZ family protein